MAQGNDFVEKRLYTYMCNRCVISNDTLKYAGNIAVKVRILRPREARNGRVFKGENLSPLLWDLMSKSTAGLFLHLPACLRNGKTSHNKDSDTSHHHFKHGWQGWVGLKRACAWTHTYHTYPQTHTQRTH